LVQDGLRFRLRFSELRRRLTRPALFYSEGR
jgi:hypothetical protein